MDPEPPAGVDTSKPTVARMYDFYLGGTNNYPADRATVDDVTKGMPYVFKMAAESRSFLHRAIRFMCTRGIDQFIDLGAGVPCADNTHQVAQRVTPKAHVLYVDIDETAVAVGQKMWAGNETTSFIHGSALELDAILSDPETKKLFDLSKPVGVLMIGLVNFLDVDVSRDLFTSLGRSLAEGSVDVLRASYGRTNTPVITRSTAELPPIFHGFRMVDPGLVLLHDWHMDMAEEGDENPPTTKAWYGVVLET
ncbi:s-adenosyl methyltransferase domain-containing protein [Pochonia chlamydosporia 170]|uniref:S-adenosyl methyltransferase domain-containing protein n=1 Tax=Pochonia chlamydosporia 170 TaxID=1380566 RepID=A0A179G7N8_METCM|nr:s-adenosyl methyltransferase domain-containing protein [Pochonia chlamydosporia 170]OAQ73807.1 s-adenosyl methyltransferase domain-containing protein [Pochonia chlamydosporia 170]